MKKAAVVAPAVGFAEVVEAGDVEDDEEGPILPAESERVGDGVEFM